MIDHGGVPSAAAARTIASKALAEGREPEAIAIVDASARRERDDAVLWHLLGLLHRSQGDLSPALAAFGAALRLTPSQPLLLHAHARARLEAGFDARDDYERARRALPSDGDVILGHVAAHAAAEDDDAADALLVATVRAHPGWLAGHHALIRRRFAAGADHEQEIDRAIAGAPRDWRLHELKLTSRLRIGHPSAAQAAAAKAPDVPELAGILAAIASEFGPASEADPRIARLDPVRDPLHRLHTLRHLLRRQRADRVVALTQQAPTRDDLPYLSLAWRLLDDPRAALLNDPGDIRVIDLPIAPPDIEELATLLRRLHRARRQPVDQSVRGGTQTDGMLLWRVDPPIARLRAQIQTAIAAELARKRHARGLVRPPAHPRLVGSWSVRLLGKGHHEAHVHPDGWLSSALYVALPAATREDGWLTLGQPQASLATGLEPTHRVEPRVGRLVLFPSHTWHATRPFDEGERLTIAFDVA